MKNICVASWFALDRYFFVTRQVLVIVRDSKIRIPKIAMSMDLSPVQSAHHLPEIGYCLILIGNNRLDI